MRIVDCLQKQKYLLFLPGQRRVQDTRYNWRLCEDSERGDASLISQSLPLCFCEISPSQAAQALGSSVCVKPFLF